MVSKLEDYYRDVKWLVDECTEAKINPDFPTRGRVYTTQQVLILELYRKLGEALELARESVDELGAYTHLDSQTQEVFDRVNQLLKEV